MINQEDWVDLLPSVLFAIRTSRHSSTGFSLFRMLYQKDPIMPFEHADRQKHDNEYDSDATQIYEPGSSGSSSSGGTSGSGHVTSASASGITPGSDSECSDDIVSTIQNLEKQHQKYLIGHIGQLKRHRNIKLRVITIGKPRVNHLR